jgi:mediator of RNA polymerase II transcription subunit 17, fungi type
MMSLEFVSLLLSKETPVQASLTLSKALRDLVGIGTLGSTLVNTTNVNAVREEDNRDVAIGWTLLSVEKTRDAAIQAQMSLMKEVELEATYWDDVLAVSQNGWSVCRLPQQRNVLGVRFGFSEASPEFRNNSFAPMRRGTDGRVELDLGRVGGGCQRIVVTLERDGKVTGRTTASMPFNSETSLEAKVLEARNTIFSQELWHELHRESHTLASYGVKTDGSSLIYKTGAGDTIRLELVTLGSDESPSEATSESHLAEAIHLCLHILLSYCHRQNETSRLRPTLPRLNRSRVYNQTHLIRPMIARITHQQSVSDLISFVGDLTKILRQSGQRDASFVLTTSPYPTTKLLNTTGDKGHASAAQALGSVLQAPTDFQVELTLTTESRISIKARTFLMPQTATLYHAHLLPPLNSTPETPTTNPLRVSCPPFEGGYPDLNGLLYYLRLATTRALADHFLAVVAATPKGIGGGTNGSDSSPWIKNVRGDSIRDMDLEKMDIRFDLGQKDGQPILEMRAVWPVERARHTEVWNWRPNQSGSGDVSGKTMLEVVTEVAKATAT